MSAIHETRVIGGSSSNGPSFSNQTMKLKNYKKTDSTNGQPIIICDSTKQKSNNKCCKNKSFSPLNSFINDNISPTIKLLTLHMSHHIMRSRFVAPTILWIKQFPLNTSPVYTSYIKIVTNSLMTQSPPYAATLSRKMNSKPTLDMPIITIPIHIQGSHWFALTRRQINKKNVFIYSDDMNSAHTEDQVKNHFSTTYTSQLHMD